MVSAVAAGLAEGSKQESPKLHLYAYQCQAINKAELAKLSDEEFDAHPLAAEVKACQYCMRDLKLHRECNLHRNRVIDEVKTVLTNARR